MSLEWLGWHTPFGQRQRNLHATGWLDREPRCQAAALEHAHDPIVGSSVLEDLLVTRGRCTC
jgi:hypothetical protein